MVVSPYFLVLFSSLIIYADRCNLFGAVYDQPPHQKGSKMVKPAFIFQRNRGTIFSKTLVAPGLVFMACGSITWK